MKIEIPENELKFAFIRSSGPGGQKVNKTATKVQVRWNIDNSNIFTEEQKENIRAYILAYHSSLITKENYIILDSEDTRYQPRNKEIVIQRLNKLINQTLKKKKKRIPTKPSKAAKERRLDEKHIQSEKKKSRQKINY